jgi:hypothetical protein
LIPVAILFFRMFRSAVNNQFLTIHQIFMGWL